MIAGQSPPSDTYNKDGLGLPFFQGKADFGELHPKTRIWCSKPVKRAKTGDILFCVRAPVGPTNVAEEECCIGRGLAAIRPGREVHQRFLLHFLRSVEQQWENKSAGSTFKAITTSDLSTFDIPLPPFASQARIAAILDKADALRRIRQEALRLTDEFLQSVFLDMFRDNQNYEPLGRNLCFITSGGRGWARYLAPTGDRFIRSLDVQMNFVSHEDAVFVDAPRNAEARRTRVQEGDVLLTITGSRIGRVAPVPKELAGAYVSQHVAILRPDTSRLSPLFLACLGSAGIGQVIQID